MNHGMPKAFYRRKLPHLQRDDKPLFVTFCTHLRWILPNSARDLVLGCCLHDNDKKIRLHVAAVMPEHVHLIFTPLINEARRDVFSLGEIMDAIKGASAHKVNQLLKRSGKVWQTESFDHVLRSSESIDQKIQYVLENPVRRGLVTRYDDYPWLWHQAFPSPYSPESLVAFPGQ